MRIDVTSGGGTVVVAAQFSLKGYRPWKAHPQAIVAEYEKVVNQVAASAGASVAVSLIEPTGQMVGGCVRSSGETTTTCRLEE